ncbi:MAG: hypothetical protein QM657_15220 [Lacrimispora sp.]|uniref:hypothetical protein n=1 Tax=Lacrimispora sp. TaxID=2719234 RepID=UPI0039E2DC99
MKFITEDDLRIVFRKEPFASFDILEGTRLTPGARQFLMDHKVMIQEGSREEKEKPGKTAEDENAAGILRENKLYMLKIKTLQAEFLEAGLELMERNVLLAEQVFDLERWLFKQGVPFHGCTGFDRESFEGPSEDCFEITGFHAQSPKGKEILILHRLRCKTRELQAEASEENLNPVINRLSQMICLEYGGSVCQKKK